MAAETNAQKASVINTLLPGVVVLPVYTAQDAVTKFYDSCDHEYEPHLLNLYAGVIDNRPLSSHNPDYDEEDAGWTLGNGTWTIVEGQIVATGSDPGGASWVATTDQNVYESIKIEADIYVIDSTASGGNGIIFRAGSATSFWAAMLHPSLDQVRLYSYTSGGGWSLVASTALTIEDTTTYTLRVEIDDNDTVDIFVDDVEKISNRDVSGQDPTGELIGLRIKDKDDVSVSEFKIWTYTPGGASVLVTDHVRRITMMGS